MTIKFEDYGRFYLTLLCKEYPNITYDGHPYSFRECARFIAYKMEQDSEVIGGVICDFETGEVVATFKPDDYDEDEEEEPDPDWGYNEDMGYDPYMGCYTDDC